ncbi:fatty acid desaturase [Phaeobacter sp. HF9A]|uniref:fatty acid desaturase n=1 Tax=Phaeobacter sp. HF9A TaxID=2721561 RepID=UPI00142FB4EB|nr:fatty acid desaturase [Phaeobacter sp. HF9A]NIZ14712.1 fatty acid desaturase [Phaeobacter sp. HF9A]
MRDLMGAAQIAQPEPSCALIEANAEARAALPQRAEWGTLALILGCYAIWFGALFALAAVSQPLAVLVISAVVVLHSSLSHEALHGHPFRARRLNEALMALPLNLCVPYGRFRDTHLQHHQDENLTDPYDDPESNFLAPRVWAGLPRWQQRLLRLNNTLLGRLLLGPLIGQLCFMRSDARLIRRGEGAVLREWILHAPGVALVLWIVAQSSLPLWAYLVAAYIGLSVLKIRTFLEHRADLAPERRTAIVEGRGILGRLLGFLFLNNNLHVVHHLYPGVPWHHLPALYRRHRAAFLAQNDGYLLPSYASVFRSYFLRAKDPVPHPFWTAPEK